MADLETKKVTCLMQGIADSINKFLKMFFGEKIGFCLLIFEFNKSNSVCRHVSNSDRKYMIDAFRKSADDLENFDKLIDEKKIMGRC